MSSFLMLKKSSIPKPRKKKNKFVLFSLLLIITASSFYGEEIPAAGMSSVAGNRESGPNSGPFFSVENFPRTEGRRPKVAVVLAGGGARGIAHISVLKAIEEAGIPVDMVGGTSMGAIVGGFYAAGYTPSEIESIVRSMDWRFLFFEGDKASLMSYREKTDLYRYPLRFFFDKHGFYNSGGILSGKNILRFFDALTSPYPKEIDFSSLPCPFFCVATDVETGEKVVLDKGSLSEAIRASMSFPGVFSPWKKDGRFLVDGGVVDNLPVQTARDYGADIVIAVNLNATEEIFDDVDRNLINSAMRSLLILMKQNGDIQASLADFLINVDVGSMQITDFDKADQLLKYGEKAVAENRDNLEKISAYLESYRNEFPYTAGIQYNSQESSEGNNRRKFSWTASSVRIEGDVPHRDIVLVEEMTEWIKGKSVSPSDCLKICRDLDSTGRFGNSRVFRVSSASGDSDELLIRLYPKEVPGNELKFNFSYNLEYSPVMLGDLDVIPALVLRGLTTERSELGVDVELMDAPGLSLYFYQPFAGIFSLSVFYGLKNDYVMRISESSIAMQYRSSFSGGGISFMIEPCMGLFFSAGTTFESVSVDDTVMEGSGKTRSLLGFARAGLSSLDHNILPEKGAEFYSNFTMSILNFTDSNKFMVLEGGGSFWLPFGKSFSAGIIFEAGTDFNFGGSFQIDGPAPVYYQPELSFRNLFPMGIYEEEKKGSLVGGIGLELKYNLTAAGDIGLLKRLPLYIILSGAAGLASSEPSEIRPGSAVVHWNLSAGVGSRLGEAFGVVLKGGVHHSIYGEFSPFFSINLGSGFCNSPQPIDLY